MLYKRYIEKLLIIKILLSLFMVSILVIPSFASDIDGSGKANIIPPSINANTKLNISILIFGTSVNGNIYDLEITFPPMWNFSGKAEDITLVGSGLSVAQIKSIEGSGQSYSPYILKITGCSINPTHSGEIRVTNLKSPEFVADSTNPANTFIIKSSQNNGILTAITTQPGIKITGGSTPSLLITEFSTKDISDFVEVKCLDDGNGGSGTDLKDYIITDMSNSAHDKKLNSLIVRSGDFIVLHYGKTDNDDTISNSGLANIYTDTKGLPDDDGQLILLDKNMKIIDSAPYANLDGTFLGYSNMNILINQGEWNGVTEYDSIFARGMEEGDSIERNYYDRDNNEKGDFTLTTVPTPGEQNIYAGLPYDIVINEVAPGYKDGDFIELYVKDDGRNGLGINLKGFKLVADSGRFVKNFNNCKVYSGDRILITFNSSNSDELESSGKIIHLFTTYSGLNPNEGAIMFVGSDKILHDFMAYAKSDNLPQEMKDYINFAIRNKQWQDSSPTYLIDFSDCVDARKNNSDTSIVRSRFSSDTDTKDDFKISSMATPGLENGTISQFFKMILEDGKEIVLRENVEKKVTLQAIDVMDNVVKNVDSYVKISTDSGTSLLSTDGIEYKSSIIESRFQDGELSFFIRDSKTGQFNINIIDKSGKVPKLTINVRVDEVINVKINEIMYKTSSTQTKIPDSADWIEIKNGSDIDYNISGYKISDGVHQFTFPENTTIGARKFIVICKSLEKHYLDDPESFSDLYGDKDGKWEIEDGFKAFEFSSMNLSESGVVSFSTPDGNGISKVSYDSTMGADGNGKTLERKNFNIESFGNIDIDRYNFLESSATYGTPGATNSVDNMDNNNFSITHEPVTSHNLFKPLYIYAEVTNCQKVELYFKDSENEIYKIREMKQINSTNVYRAKINSSEINSTELNYYIRAYDGSQYKRSPEQGENAPYTINIIDERNRVIFQTPIQVIGENETFYVDVLLKNQINPVTSLDFEIQYDKNYFSPIDKDNSRPGIQVEVGSDFSEYYAEINEIDSDNGIIKLKLVDTQGSAKGDLKIARIYFSSPEKIEDENLVKSNITFSKYLINGRDIETIINGSLSLKRETSWVVGREGGTITGSNGAEMIIPQNALLTPVTIKMKKLSLNEIPPTNVLDSQNGIKSTKIAFEFLPEYLEFRRPVKIKIPYSTTELQYSSVKDPSKLKIYFWNNKTIAWERVGGHEESGHIVVDVNHFTTYILVEDKQILQPSAKNISFSPNPFSPNNNGWNDVTTMSFTLGNDGDVTVAIYDVRGVKLRTIADKKRMFAGSNKLEWDGKDDFGNILRTGIYLFKFKAVEDDGSMVSNQGTVVISKNMKDW